MRNNLTLRPIRHTPTTMPLPVKGTRIILEYPGNRFQVGLYDGAPVPPETVRWMSLDADTPTWIAPSATFEYGPWVPALLPPEEVDFMVFDSMGTEQVPPFSGPADMMVVLRYFNEYGVYAWYPAPRPNDVAKALRTHEATVPRLPTQQTRDPFFTPTTT